MLIRSNTTLAFRTAGPMPAPRPNRLLANSTFSGPYMRPNQSTDGTIPAPGPYSASPDIWIGATNAVPNYKTALATAQSYATESDNNVFSGQGNFIYVRAKNGAATTSKNMTVQLYYAPSGVIQQPSRWQANVIPTDKGANTGSLAPITAGGVGVCDATFMWSDPGPPPSGSDHYCLFAQINDAQNSNPFPNVESVFDMSSLIMNNLGWGWRNTSMIPADSTWQVSEPMAIPDNYPTQTYSVVVQPTAGPSGGWQNWSVEFYCSQADSRGNAIRLNKTQITQNGQILGLSNVVLDGGWQGQMFINLYSPDGRSAPTGASMPLSCNYVAHSAVEVREAAHRGLIDWQYLYALKRYNPELFVGPTAILIQGTYSGTVNNNPSVIAWWKQRGYTAKGKRS